MVIARDLELLERERELSILDELIAAATQGAGRLVVVEGPAGIGKTSLLGAARAKAMRAGMRTLGARGSELEREFAHGVVRQLFEPILAAAQPAERAELLAGAAARTAVLFEKVDAATAATAGDVSFATLHGLFWLTANICAREPLLLVVDDLHWSDVPSLRFLTYLLPRLDGLPLLVLAGLRRAEPDTDRYLLAQITTDPLVRMMRLAPLSQPASAQLVHTVLTTRADEAFCLACHTAAGGNPLLVRELADIAAAEGIEPTAAGAARLTALGPRVVGQRVALRLTRLGPGAVALCGAVAILGDGASPADAATLAGTEPAETLQTARQLADIEILYRQVPSPEDAATSPGRLGFVHPLVRTAVYEGLSETARLDGHARAARLLADRGVAAEQVAAHLLLVPPAGDGFAVATLRQAADEAFARGSPDSAVAYLERCVQEPPPDRERADILLQLGTAAQLVDVAKGADYLAAAMAATSDTNRRIAIAEMRAIALQPAGRSNEAVQILAEAIQALGAEYCDLRRRLEALLLGAMFLDPEQHPSALRRIERLRGIAPGSGTGDGMLGIALAFYDALAGASAEAIGARVRRSLAGGLTEQANVIPVYACHLLIAADQEEVMPLLDAWVAEAHRRGSVRALAPAKCFRGLAWLARGALAEAETNLRDAMWAATMASQYVGLPVIAAFLADALLEQGRLDEAAAALDRAAGPGPLPRVGYWFWFLDSRGRLLLQQGRAAQALEAIRAGGDRFAAVGGQNPALLAWRSDAALALSTLDHQAEARALAAEELALARQWGAPGALGRALRVAGLVRGGPEGLPLLREAVHVLASCPARLEYAKALIELGTALRRCGHRLESRQHLRKGVELAQISGAVPLVERGWTELRATGARPRRLAPSGPDALTPSELRVAELAAAGQSNRDIAQTLFITTNTVEVHLTRVYRKLDVTGRTGLTARLSKS